MKALVIFLIRLYQKTLSPDHGWFSHVQHPGGYCRYQPTCSSYAIQAIESHGLLKGGFLALARVSRCHPWSAVGADPVLDPQHN